MYKLLVLAFDHLKSLYKFFRNYIQIFVFIICLFYVIINYNNIIENIVYINFKSINFYFSFFLVFFGIFLGGIVWNLILISSEFKIKFLKSLDIHFSSNIAKYIPGFAWQIFGKFLLTNEIIKEKKIVGRLILKEFLLIIISGYQIFSIIFLIEKSINQELTFVFPSYLKIFIVLSNIIILLFFIYYFRKFPIYLLIGKISKDLLILFIIYLAWIINSLSLYFLIFSTGARIEIIYSIFVLSASYLVGFLIFIVPGSFGIREGVLVLLLQMVIDKDLAIVISILTRLLTMSGELFWFLTIKLLTKINNPK